jgi:DNA-binding phage protein
MNSEELQNFLFKEAQEEGITRLAETSGMMRAHIYQVLRGNEHNWTINSIRKIASGLGYEIDFRIIKVVAE